jgi:hypothetical protein
MAASMAQRRMLGLVQEQSHAQPLRLLLREVRPGAAPPAVKELLLAAMPRSAQGLAAGGARQARELVRLPSGRELERNPLRWRGTLRLTAAAPWVDR